jgi:hypothetical protein
MGIQDENRSLNLTIRVFTYFHSSRWFCFHPLNVSPLDLSTLDVSPLDGPPMDLSSLVVSYHFLECLEIGE